VGFVVDIVALGQVFSEYFGFPCQSSSSIIRGWYIRPTVADVPNRLSLTPPRKTKKEIKGKFNENFSSGEPVSWPGFAPDISRTLVKTLTV
jgi:hypothetical protein